MSVLIKQEDKRITAVLEGEIDHHSAAQMRREIDEAVGQSQPETLVLDFGGVTFMDSSGIGLVMGRYRLVHEYGGLVRVQNPPPHIRKVMKVAGLETIASIESGGM